MTADSTPVYLKLRRRAQARARAEMLLEEAIVEAHLAGLSYRAISEWVGLNHETVRTIVRRRT